MWEDEREFNRYKLKEHGYRFTSRMTSTIKLGQLKKGKPLLDKDVYGFRINIMRGKGAIKYVKKQI
jgi:hypothetical protein